MLPRRHRRLVLDPVNQLELVLTLERVTKGQQLVERRTQRVDVTATVRDAPEPLGGHVPQGPDQVLRLRKVVPLLELGQAEVGDPDVPQRIQDQIGRLDVAVQDASLVRVSQGVGDLGTQPGDFAIVTNIGLPGQRAGCVVSRQCLRIIGRLPDAGGRSCGGRSSRFGLAQLRHEATGRRAQVCRLRHGSHGSSQKEVSVSCSPEFSSAPGIANRPVRSPSVTVSLRDFVAHVRLSSLATSSCSPRLSA